MSIRVAVRHSIEYKYDKHVQLSPQEIRLRPAPHCRTPIEAYTLKISPGNHFINWQQDPFGNYMARVVFPNTTQHFKVDVEVIADLETINPFDFFLEEESEAIPITYNEVLKKDLLPYFEFSEESESLEKFIEPFKNKNEISTIDFLVELNQAVYNALTYTIRLEEGIQTCEETFQLGSGSCRDSAWLLVQALRRLGMAARFVSGYLIQLKADKESIDGPSGPEEDFTDLHAWCEVFIPGAGWIGLDTTSGLFASEGHLPLCCTPNPVSAAAITGYITGNANVEFKYSNKVYRIKETPRTSLPYSDNQWLDIDSLGTKVDAVLNKNNIHLTMGGEPTFVSNSDMESEQWNTDADGMDKRALGYKLAQKQLASYNTHGLIHYGTGKWYPGEPIPRWKYGIYWRKDGQKIIKDPNNYADPNEKTDYNFKHAELLINQVANKLFSSTKSIISAYEDIYYYLWQEDKLPLNINPLNVNLNDQLERKTLMSALKDGLNNPKGFCLPIKFDQESDIWLTSPWKIRSKNLFLIPGNSPLGLRLPIDSLPHMVSAQEPLSYPRSPFETTPILPDYIKRINQQQQTQGKLTEKVPDDWLYPTQKLEKEDKDEDYVVKKKDKQEEVEPESRMFTIKTALSTEIRDGKILVFFPPLDRIEHYLELLSIVEEAAENLGIKILVEGYEPPRDNRIEKLDVTPDPGVIEVNIHPAKDWGEIKANYGTLFNNALQIGLGTEKFMLDGKHTGTGGGHHITLGGITPAESPLLKHPHILKSMVLFWQNHPSLSYLFSSAFIGATSQAPRLDEGRPEMLYELEIALKQIKKDQEYPFWHADRLLRNILIDLTGNTHRAEFCIDKLYSPDSSTGRLGILELRGFEMPPEEKMCLVQILLVRTLFAYFVENPYNNRPVKWGNMLHDKFMIHHFIKQDITEVIHTLNDAGFDFKLEWLEPFFEFRFPKLGTTNIHGIELQLRMGIEPWQVLGEEMGTGGTARFVDSSLERIEIKVKGIQQERYSVLVNGIQVPLINTGKNEEFVSGVRYKAWAPPSALHPLLPVDVPLQIDIYDKWNNKVIGGCQYHVTHAGGRSYDTYPINALEAESRRTNRFFNFGHSLDDTVNVDIEYSDSHEQTSRNIQYYSDERVLKSEPPVYIPSNEMPYTFDLTKS